LLLIPLSAAAGFAVVNGVATQPAEPDTTLALQPPPTTTGTAATEVIVEPVNASAADLDSACGPDGMTLIGAEADGTITDVQQAALDALRQICEQNGSPLPGPAAPPPVVKTVVQASNTGASSATAAGTGEGSAYEDDDHGEHEDQGEHEDHEDEHEHEDEHGDDD
jgi:hypothetical protein